MADNALVSTVSAPSGRRGGAIHNFDTVNERDTVIRLGRDTGDDAEIRPPSVVYVKPTDVPPLTDMLNAMASNDKVRRFNAMKTAQRTKQRDGIELPSVSVFPQPTDSGTCFWCGENTNTDSGTLRVTQCVPDPEREDATNYRNVFLHQTCVGNACDAMTAALSDIDLNKRV